MKRRTLVIIVVVVLLALGVAVAASFLHDGLSSRATPGKLETMAARKMRRLAMPANARLAQNPITFQAFVNYVRMPRGSMPPFGNQVREAELADIYAFLKSVPPSPDPKSIPLLNQIN